MNDTLCTTNHCPELAFFLLRNLPGHDLGLEFVKHVQAVAINSNCNFAVSSVEIVSEGHGLEGLLSIYKVCQR